MKLENLNYINISIFNKYIRFNSEKMYYIRMREILINIENRTF